VSIFESRCIPDHSKHDTFTILFHVNDQLELMRERRDFKRSKVVKMTLKF
jgi:hypothetical protein